MYRDKLRLCMTPTPVRCTRDLHSSLSYQRVLDFSKALWTVWMSGVFAIQNNSKTLINRISRFKHVCQKVLCSELKNKIIGLAFVSRISHANKECILTSFCTLTSFANLGISHWVIVFKSHTTPDLSAPTLRPPLLHLNVKAR